MVFEKDCQNREPDELSELPLDVSSGQFLTSIIESRYICKLTDFGISSHTTEDIILGGSRPWQAPECTRRAFFKREAAKRTDIYSFGIVLWEILTRLEPFKGNKDP